MPGPADGPEPAIAPMLQDPVVGPASAASPSPGRASPDPDRVGSLRVGSLRVGIIGASGFVGAELLRLLSGHPVFEVVAVTGETQAGVKVRDLYPSLAVPCADMTYGSYAPADFTGLDVVFLALPHMASQPIVQDLYKRVGCVLDLGADFRLRDPDLYAAWYGHEHTCPELIDEFVYGLPELHRAALRGAAAVAVPGCYPTAAALALAPFVARSRIERCGVIVDAASGISGAGRVPKPTTTFASVDADVVAYGLLSHRHTPEIEQETGCEVLFTPHLVPMTRGIAMTCYARPSMGERPYGTDEALADLADAYGAEPFVVVSEDPPHTKAAYGANTAHLSARVDARTGWLVVLAAIDNLVKGAAGQAVQCANAALGIDETVGLPSAGVMP